MIAPVQSSPAAENNGIRIREQKTAHGACVGWLTLDSPQTLNALTLPMVDTLRYQLDVWAHRTDIACVVLTGEGRAFCAGGDVRRMRQGILGGDDYCERFFESEYRLDYAIHTYPKPLLVWGHGVVMGGGLGLLVGATHRVVTRSSRMAMPEVNIGLYPDVGAGYFLNRLPSGLGLFLGISACEWNGADAVSMGIADYLLAENARVTLEQQLGKAGWVSTPNENRLILTRVLQGLQPAEQHTQVMHESNALDSTCCAPLPQVMRRLTALPINQPWFEQAMKTLYRGCPVSICLVEAMLERAKGKSLADVFRQDWTMSVQCARHPDFPEGVRAQLVDKDKSPRWSFTSVEAVPEHLINAHFECPVASHPLHDLK